MAQINTTFSFQDQITQGLTQLNNTLTTLNNTLNSMQGQAVNAGNELDGLGKKSEAVGKKSSSLLEKLLTIDTATRVFNTVKGAVDSLGRSIDECSQLYNFQFEQETKLEAVMRNHMKANDEQIQSIKDFASSQQDIGIYGDEMQLAGLQELATYVDDAETLKGLLPALNSMIAQSEGFGATTNTYMQYATMMGKVMMGEAGGMSKRGYKFTDEEKEILKTGTELEKVEVIQRAVLGNFGDMNQALRQTPQGQIVALSNAIGDAKEEIGKALIPYMRFFKLSTMEWKLKWYTAIKKALDWVKTHIKGVAIAVTGALAAIGVALLALATYFVIVKRQAIASALATAAAWAVAHLPILAIVAAILAVIAIIGILLAYSEKTFPAIGGFIGGIGEVAKEVGAQIKYWFGWAIEGIVNGFLKAKDKVGDFLLEIADKILGLVEFAAPLIDLLFQTHLQQGLADARKAITAWQNKPQKDFSLGWHDDRTPGGIKDAWKRGQRAGETAGAQKSAAFQSWHDEKLAVFKNNEMKSAEMGIPDDQLADMLKTDGSGALIVKDQGLVDIAADYRELLSKQATEKFNLRFSQVTPNVTFGDVNINSEKDGENIFEKIVGKMEELESSYLGG